MSCGAFPDPVQVPAPFLTSELPSCGRRAGHQPPHRAELWQTDDNGSYGPVVLEWEDPPYFVEVLRDLEARFGRQAIRMWVERAPEPEELHVRPLHSGPWLHPPVNWGPLPPPVAVASLEEFRRAYGKAPEGGWGLEYDALAQRFAEDDDGQDTEDFEPVSGDGPTFTVDKYGSTFSVTRVPIPAGWRGWPVRARIRVRQAWELWGDVAWQLDRARWWVEDGLWNWRAKRRRRKG